MIELEYFEIHTGKHVESGCYALLCIAHLHYLI